MTRRPGVALAAGVLALSTALLLAACGGPGPGGSGDASGPVVVTFEVIDEQFKALLTDPADIDIARRLLAGEDAPGIPNGRVIRETGVNVGYSWSLDPNDFEWADATIELCDALPSDIEAGIVSGDRYCPWAAVVIDVQPAA